MTHYQTVLPGEKHWSLIVRAGMELSLTDVQGGGNAGMLLYNPENLLERYNAPDTLKCQQTFLLTAGHCLYSDMGRIFCTIVADTLGWHDTVGGTTTRADLRAPTTYQQARNDFTQTGRHSFLIEAAKYGLGRRDLAANINWLSKISVGAAGAMRFHPDHAPPGAQVSLRFDMDTLVLLHTCPHPMHPAPSARPIAIELAPAHTAAPSGATLPENLRGALNNALYHQCARGD